MNGRRPQMLEPVQSDEATWAQMAVLAVVFCGRMRDVAAKGLLHWTIVCGINHRSVRLDSYPRRTSATVFFASSIRGGVGLWLAAPWGGGVATSVISMPRGGSVSSNLRRQHGVVE